MSSRRRARLKPALLALLGPDPVEQRRDLLVDAYCNAVATSAGDSTGGLGDGAGPGGGGRIGGAAGEVVGGAGRPSARAMPLPMPRLAPVTMAILPGSAT